ncbi:hypothetical protein DXG01_009202 [Tephrocybe rancida]|nr:hypothetical protein DXG01_009202 [Tephrocybe rancida]
MPAVFGTPLAMLNSQAAMDLLDKRGQLYSDRPHLPMAADFSGMADLTPLVRYGEKFQFGRRLMNQALSTRVVTKWEQGIAEESRAMLKLLHTRPTEFIGHLNKMTGAMVMMSMYGHRVIADDDPYVKLAIEFMEASADAITGRWIIDFLPIAKYIPGLAFHKQAAAWRARVPDWVDKAFDSFKENMDSSEDAKNSLCGSLMITPDGSLVDQETENRVKWIATSGFGAGLDVMVACLSQFIMAMALNPRAQSQAQKEIDEVIGRDRFPEFSDRESLPYMECIFKETLRWGTPAPLYIFKPERFLGLDPKEAAKLDPTNYVFGFGRNHFAHSAVWFSMVGILSAFEVSPDVDKGGHTKPFKVRFTPRHRKVPDLLSQ